eukprot:scaffold3916_cov138-Skeletonema_marinoi.AAC.1
MSFNSPIRQRTASENEVRDRLVRSTNSSGAATPPRSSSKQMYTTEFIKALFGDTGVVVGDYSCSYQRQAGRLYVSTDAVFFYSNLFGFEKRIKIDYTNAVEIDLVRTTSVFIKTSDEEFIFRSFKGEDRQSVLELIKTFHSKTSSSLDIPSAIHSVDTQSDDLASLSEHDDNETKQQLPTSQDSPEDTAINTSKAGSIVPNSLEGTLLWEQMKKHSKDWDSIITAQKLQFNSVSDFFDTFLRDSSPRSMSYFQSKVMGDSNVSLEAWAKNTAPEGESSAAADSLSRVFEFEKTTRWAVAKVKRRQTYQTCGKNAIIQNFTHLLGIPQADAFFVEDMWLLETEATHVTLNVKCRIVWLKNTMLKSVITNRTKTEAKEWFDKYIPYVSQKSDETPIPVQREEVAAETNQVISVLFSIAKFARFIFRLCRESPVFALLILLAIYTYHLKQRIVLLEKLVDEVQMNMIQQLDRLSAGQIDT